MDDGRNNGEKTGRKPPPVEHQFKPGNPGRPKGSRNKLGEAFIEALHEDFENDGAAAIVACRTEKPDAYLKVIASILPKELKVTTENDLTDEELVERIRQLDAAIRPFLDAEGESGASSGVGSSKPH